VVNSTPETPYADKTFSDRNPLKRYLQQRRLRDAMALVQGLADPAVVVDFGAGNGEFCKYLVTRFPAAQVFCFEPHPGLLQQARENLAAHASVSFHSEFEELPIGQADLVFCLEVFEHLPTAESAQALARMVSLLGGTGHAVIGVPVEIGLPALYKGVFRMARRYGAFDARLGNVLGSSLGRPPAERPVVELMPGSYYHLHHLGFDHRSFRLHLEPHFRLIRQSTSPMPLGGTWLNAELNLLLAVREPAGVA
jgi:SAM-dependent methyltransferase